jgi:hypothetical protein
VTTTAARKGETLIMADEPEVEALDRNRRAIARALAREDPVLQMDLIRAWAAEEAQAPGSVARIAAWRLEDRVNAYFEAHPEAMERLVRREVEALVRALVAMARSFRALNPTRAGSHR